MSFAEESKSKNFMKKEIATDTVFYKLKKREEELKNEFKKHMKMKRQSYSRNNFIADDSFSHIDGINEDMRKKIIKFRDDVNISGISFSRNDSKDELELEEEYQRLLTKTSLKTTQKKKKKKKSKHRVRYPSINHSFRRKRNRCTCTKE